MEQLARYIDPISTAMWVFPFVALVFTAPYVISCYRRYGAVLFFRALIVYSFIFYMLCVYFLGILPLPSFEEVAAMTREWAQLEPLRGIRLALAEANFSWSEPASWLRVLRTENFFYIAANVAMLFPLGIYLRYAFRQGFFSTVRWGFVVSLSIELLQLTGLLFIYPRPYRLCDVDDLIANTLGAALGYLVTPLPMKILPSQEKLDRVAYQRGERVSIMRAAVAAGVDWALCALVALPLASLLGLRGAGSTGIVYIACVLVYFIWIQYIARGRTLGKWLCRIRLVSEDGSRPRLWQVALRCVSLYLVLLVAPYAGFRAWNAMIDLTGRRFFAMGVAAVACLGVFAVFVFTCFVNLLTRASRLPHERVSRTRNQSTIRHDGAGA